MVSRRTKKEQPGTDSRHRKLVRSSQKNPTGAGSSRGLAASAETTGKRVDLAKDSPMMLKQARIWTDEESGKLWRRSRTRVKEKNKELKSRSMSLYKYELQVVILHHMMTR